jgi:non-heme chloroperoxidase
MRVPVLVVHGTADAVVAPSAAQYAAGKIPGASLRWLQAVGHLPFAERIEEFNTALRELADRCGRTPT